MGCSSQVKDGVHTANATGHRGVDLGSQIVVDNLETVLVSLKALDACDSIKIAS